MLPAPEAGELALALLPEGEREARAEQDEERRDGDHVPHELDLERAGNEEVRHDPGQEQHLDARVGPAQGQRRQQHGGRNDGREPDGDYGVRPDQNGGGQDQAER